MSEPDAIRKYLPMTDEEFQASLHVAIVRNLDKLPRLKGVGKAAAGERDAKLQAFSEAVAKHFASHVFIKKPGWTAPAPNVTHGHRSPVPGSRE